MKKTLQPSRVQNEKELDEFYRNKRLSQGYVHKKSNTMKDTVSQNTSFTIHTIEDSLDA